MTEPAHGPEPGDRLSDGDEAHRMPTWVKGLVVAALVAAALLLIVLVLADGDHGPGRHLPDGDAAGTQSTHGRTPPVGHG